MSERAKKILASAEKVTKLRAQLAEAVEEFERLLGEKKASEPSVDHRRTAGKRGPAPDPTSMAGRIRAVLSREPERVFTAEEVTQALGFKPSETRRVSMMLYTQSALKRIDKAGIGRFRARPQPAP